MEHKIKILTVTKCTPREGTPYTRLDIVNLGQVVKSENVKGNLVSPMFITGHEAFSKIPESIIGQEVSLELTYEPNDRNPMKPRAVIKAIHTKNGIISLV